MMHFIFIVEKIQIGCPQRITFNNAFQSVEISVMINLHFRVSLCREYEASIMQTACHDLDMNVQEVSSLHTGQNSYSVQNYDLVSVGFRPIGPQTPSPGKTQK